MLYTYSVVPLIVNQIDEICEDIREQYENKITVCPLFVMKLHPEGNPPIDKVNNQCLVYDLFRDKLDSMGIPSGILVQSSLGHGYKLNMEPSFTTVINLASGESMTVQCPEDKRLQEYFRNVFAVLARHKPKAIMVDDDFRLLHWRGGCACELHMAEFNRRTGLQMTRQELYSHIMSHDDNDLLTQIYLETQSDSLFKMITAMREGIDSVDPTIQGINCTSGQICENVVRNNAVFCGKGNPTIARIPNGIYSPESMHSFSDLMFKTAACIANLRGKIDYVLSETDTIPFNRYGKSAAYLHAHYTASLLDGCMGAKHWITRLRGHEPESGKIYRKILAENSAMYEKISEIASEINWFGVCMPLGVSDKFSFHKEYFQDCDWIVRNFERMGIPFYFSDKPHSAVFINGECDYALTDEQLSHIFDNCSVFLSSDAAESISKRGYSDKIGVSVREWTGKTLTGELFPDGNTCENQFGLKELIPDNENVYSASSVYRLENDTEKQIVFPSVAVYPRDNRNMTVTYCGTPKADFHYSVGFSFLNATRKKQFIELLKKVNSLPIYYKDDAEICLRAGSLPNGEIIVAFWNLGLDTLDEIVFVTEKEVHKVEILCSNGERKPIEFDVCGNELKISKQILPMMPYILFIL